jgi:hypothetical protein
MSNEIRSMALYISTPTTFLDKSVLTLAVPHFSDRRLLHSYLPQADLPHGCCLKLSRNRRTCVSNLYTFNATCIDKWQNLYMLFA